MNLEKQFSNEDLRKTIPDGINEYDEYKNEEKTFKKEIEKKKEENEMVTEARHRMKPFIEEAIRTGKLRFFGSHGHLGYNDDKYWGHYIFPTEEGVNVVVYFQKNIKGDPMDIEGERGESFSVEFRLDEILRKKIADQIETELKESGDPYNELGETLEIINRGLGK